MQLEEFKGILEGCTRRVQYKEDSATYAFANPADPKGRKRLNRGEGIHQDQFAQYLTGGEDWFYCKSGRKYLRYDGTSIGESFTTSNTKGEPAACRSYSFDRNTGVEKALIPLNGASYIISSRNGTVFKLCRVEEGIFPKSDFFKLHEGQWCRERAEDLRDVSDLANSEEVCLIEEVIGSLRQRNLINIYAGQTFETYEEMLRLAKERQERGGVLEL